MLLGKNDGRSGLVGPMRSRADCQEALRKLREETEGAEAEHEVNATIRPDLQVRHRRG